MPAVRTGHQSRMLAAFIDTCHIPIAIRAPDLLRRSGKYDLEVDDVQIVLRAGAPCGADRTEEAGLSGLQGRIRRDAARRAGRRSPLHGRGAAQLSQLTAWNRSWNRDAACSVCGSEATRRDVTKCPMWRLRVELSGDRHCNQLDTGRAPSSGSQDTREQTQKNICPGPWNIESHDRGYEGSFVELSVPGQEPRLIEVSSSKADYGTG